MTEGLEYIEYNNRFNNSFQNNSKVEKDYYNDVNMFKILLEYSYSGNLILNYENYDIVYFNPKLIKMLHIEVGELTKNFLKDFLNLSNLKNDLKKLFNNEIESFSYEKRYNNQKLYCFMVTISLYKNNFLIQLNDITKQKEYEAKIESIVESTEKIIWSIDNNYNLISFNSSFYEYMFNSFNIKIEIGTNLKEFINENSVCIEEYKKAFNGEHICIEKMIGDSHFHISVTPIFINKEIIGISIFSKDITDKKLMEIELVESEKKFRGAFENSPIGMAIIDLDGKIIKLNKNLCEITGYSDIELLNTSLDKITHKDDLEKKIQYLELVKKGYLNKFNIDKRYYKKNGDIVWVHVSYSSIKDSNNNINYFISQIQDITHKREFDTQLINKNIELNKINSELEQFSYLVSHDLQAPLNSIRRYSEEMSLNTYENDKKNIIKACNRMKSFISDLLIYSKLARKMPLEVIDTNIVLDNVINSLKDSISKSRAVISYEYLPDLVANAIKIEQVFQNILSNSIKYCKKEVAPNIYIDCVEEGKFWKFSISDNGIGIPSEYHDLIFQSFKRLHSEDNYSGNGIGLFICKKIIEQFNGKIWLESEINKGTTFYFTIPKIS